MKGGQAGELVRKYVGSGLHVDLLERRVILRFGAREAGPIFGKWGFSQMNVGLREQ